MINYLTKDNFKSVIEKEERTVIVDFYADWCMPCKMIAPFLEQISNENENVAVYKVDIDQNPELAVMFDIKSIPNLISFKNGAVHKRALGAIPKASILELID